MQGHTAHLFSVLNLPATRRLQASYHLVPIPQVDLGQERHHVKNKNEEKQFGSVSPLF